MRSNTLLKNDILSIGEVYILCSFILNLVFVSLNVSSCFCVKDWRKIPTVQSNGEKFYQFDSARFKISHMLTTFICSRKIPESNPECDIYSYLIQL